MCVVSMCRQCVFLLCCPMVARSFVSTRHGKERLVATLDDGFWIPELGKK